MPGAVDRRGKSCRQEVDGIAPGGTTGAGHGGAGPGHQLRQARGEQWVGRAGLDQGEMGGRALVEVDEFVGFRSREFAPAVQEVAQTVPLDAVGVDEDIEVHGRLLLLAWVCTGPYNCGALRVSLADCGPEGQGWSAKGGGGNE